MARKQQLTTPSAHKHPLGVAEDAADDGYAPRSRGGLYTFLMFTGGLGLVALGFGLAFAPQVSWRLVKLGRLMEPLGIENGVAIVGGFVLLGMSLLARKVTLSGMASPPPPPEEKGHVADELMDELTQLKSTLFQLSEEISGLNETQQALVQHQAAAAQPQPGAGGIEGQSDALFRLAASLDQLHARLDERMNTMVERVHERMDRVSTAVDSARASLEARITETAGVPGGSGGSGSGSGSGSGMESAHSGGLLGSPTVQGPSSYAPTAQPPVAPPTLGGSDLEILVDLEPGEEERQNEEFFHTLDELNALVQEDPGAGAPPPQRPPTGPMDPTHDLDALWPDDNAPKA